jgi:hypothetical protein
MLGLKDLVDTFLNTLATNFVTELAFPIAVGLMVLVYLLIKRLVIRFSGARGEKLISRHDTKVYEPPKPQELPRSDVFNQTLPEDYVKRWNEPDFVQSISEVRLLDY